MKLQGIQSSRHRPLSGFITGKWPPLREVCSDNLADQDLTPFISTSTLMEKRGPRGTRWEGIGSEGAKAAPLPRCARKRSL